MKIIRISELKKMKKNNKLMIIFLLFSISNNLTFCLESTDYCSLKYREQKCHGSFSYRCDSIQLICSKGIKQCIDYKQKNTYIKLMYEYQKTNPLNKHVQERVTFKLFNKDIKHCKFKFKADDLCLNKKNCTEKKLKPTEFGFKLQIQNVDCKCQTSHKGFKCGQYCAAHSDACNHFESNMKNMSKIMLKKINNNCRNDME